MFRYRRSTNVHAYLAVFMFYRIVAISCRLFVASFSMPAPIVPPRFDNFCEQIVGTWNPLENSKASSNVFRQVEEVMRSCGGAVQGIREESFLNSIGNASSTSESIYHNRADDGFVYFDCGTYTQGPVHLGSDTLLRGPHAPVVSSSISFSTLPKSRLIFDLSSNSWSALIRSSTAANSESDHLNHAIMVDNQDFNFDDIQWGKETICRMDNRNQSWMLQRAKWEALTIDTNQLLKSKYMMNLDNVEFKGWIKVWDGASHNIGHDAGTHPKLATLSLPNGYTPHRMIQVGGACMNSGEVKSLVRYYDGDGSLQAVILQEGLLV